jgi:hypothetical protein
MRKNISIFLSLSCLFVPSLLLANVHFCPIPNSTILYKSTCIVPYGWELDSASSNCYHRGFLGSSSFDHARYIISENKTTIICDYSGPFNIDSYKFTLIHTINKKGGIPQEGNWVQSSNDKTEFTCSPDAGFRSVSDCPFSDD